jgi:hypothetical protein
MERGFSPASKPRREALPLCRRPERRCSRSNLIFLCCCLFFHSQPPSSGQPGRARLRVAHRQLRPSTDQLQANAIQTPEAVPLAPLTIKSTKFPAATATLPDTVHAVPDAAEHDNDVSAIAVGVPCRRITVTVFAWRENTLNCVAVQPVGTQVSTESPSVFVAFELVAE